MAFRFCLQPVMSMICATSHGLKDAREHKPPYFWDILTNPTHQRAIREIPRPIGGTRRQLGKSLGKCHVRGVFELAQDLETLAV